MVEDFGLALPADRRAGRAWSIGVVSPARPGAARVAARGSGCSGKDLDDLDELGPELADKATDPLGVALLLVIVVLGAPVVEELFFRGLLQRSVAAAAGPGRWPWSSPAVVFGLTHFQLLQFPALVAFGAVLGCLALRTGRLGPVDRGPHGLQRGRPSSPLVLDVLTGRRSDPDAGSPARWRRCDGHHEPMPP